MLRQLKRMSAEKVVLYAIRLGIIAFIIWMSFVVGLWLLLNAMGVEADLPSLMEGLSSAAAFALTVGGGIVVLVQINESIDSRNVSVFNDVFERMMSDEELEARRYVYMDLPDNPEEGIDGLSEEGRSKVKLVLNSFDYLGFLLQQGWITEEAAESVIAWISPIVVKSWRKLGPYVDYEAQRRDDPHYYSTVRYLAENCVNWHEINRSGHEYKMMEGAL